MSPSPSTSAAKTELAPSAKVEITCCGATEDHPRADLLKRKGLFITTPDIPIDIVTSAELLDVCAERAKALKPLHQWLVRLLAAS